jgi:hypothetical protein
MDMTQYRFAYIMICGPGLADIRAYFPREERHNASESLEQDVPKENGEAPPQTKTSEGEVQ